MGYKSYISKKDSRRLLKLPPDYDVGSISQQYIPSDIPEDKFSKWSNQYDMDCEFKFVKVGN